MEEILSLNVDYPSSPVTSELTNSGTGVSDPADEGGQRRRDVTRSLINLELDSEDLINVLVFMFTFLISSTNAGQTKGLLRERDVTVKTNSRNGFANTHLRSR